MGGWPSAPSAIGLDAGIDVAVVWQRNTITSAASDIRSGRRRIEQAG
jgi:hypothetical protein